MKKVIYSLCLVFLLSACTTTPETKLTIKNEWLYDLTLAFWYDHDGNFYYFGDDVVWDDTFKVFVNGILVNNSDTESVQSGNTHLYFSFTGTALFATQESIEIKEGNHITFILTEETPIMVWD